MKMNIYHLWRLECSWDETRALVVIAPHQARAKEMAQDNCGDEDPEVWLHCQIEILGPAFSEEPRVVCRDVLEA